MGSCSGSRSRERSAFSESEPQVFLPFAPLLFPRSGWVSHEKPRSPGPPGHSELGAEEEYKCRPQGIYGYKSPSPPPHLQHFARSRCQPTWERPTEDSGSGLQPGQGMQGSEWTWAQPEYTSCAHLTLIWIIASSCLGHQK